MNLMKTFGGAVNKKVLGILFRKMPQLFIGTKLMNPDKLPTVAEDLIVNINTGADFALNVLTPIFAIEFAKWIDKNQITMIGDQEMWWWDRNDNLNPKISSNDLLQIFAKQYNPIK